MLSLQLSPLLCLQGDLLFAEELTKRMKPCHGQPRMLAAFINQAVPVRDTVSRLRITRADEASWLGTWRSKSIYLHKTYVGVALQVSQRCVAYFTTCMLCLIMHVVKSAFQGHLLASAAPRPHIACGSACLVLQAPPAATCPSLSAFGACHMCIRCC